LRGKNRDCVPAAEKRNAKLINTHIVKIAGLLINGITKKRDPAKETQNRQCTQCGKKLGVRFTNSICKNCMEKRKKYNKQYYKDKFSELSEKRKAIYAERKQTHQCPQCGKKKRKTDGHTFCEDCRAYQRNYRKEKSSRYRDRNRDKKRALYAKRKQNHQCPQCGKKLGLRYTKIKCKNCMEKSRQYNNEKSSEINDKRRALYAERKQNRQCPNCGKKKRKTDKHSFCEDCRAYQRNYYKERSSERTQNRQCTQCGKKLGVRYTKIKCKNCLEKSKQYYNEKSSELSEKKKAISAGRKQNRQCPNCGKKLGLRYTKTLCKDCLEKSRQYIKQYRNLKFSPKPH